METDRITVKEAAAMLGMSQQGVREHMKRDLFQPPIGHVTQVSTQKQYHIYRNMVEAYISSGTTTQVPPTEEKRSPDAMIGEIFLQAFRQIVQTATKN